MRGAPCRPVLKTLLLSPLSLTPQVVGRGKHATSRKARCSHCCPRTPRPATSSRMDQQLSSECQGANCDSSTDDTKRGLMRRALLATYETHLREGCRRHTCGGHSLQHALPGLISSRADQNRHISKNGLRERDRKDAGVCGLTHVHGIQAILVAALVIYLILDNRKWYGIKP